MKCVLKLFGWRFFLKPAGLELAFLNTWNLSLLPFFIFCFEYPINCPCLIGFYLKYWKLIWKMVVFGKGIKFFGWMNKPNHKIKKLFIRPKNLILFRLQVFIVFYWSNVMAFFFIGIVFCGHFLDLIFEDAKTWFEKRSFNVIGMLYWKREASSKNNAL